MIKLLKPTLTFLMLFILAQGFSQTKTITGKVTDSTNNPLQGATVNAGDAKHSVLTDANGNFTLNAPANATSIQVSYVGMTTATASIENTSSVTVVLKPISSVLSDVVVIGYGTQRRKDVTGSVASITGTTIEKVPVTTLDQAMQGRAAGVQIVNNDAAPGGNVSVLIRGIGSI